MQLTDHFTLAELTASNKAQQLRIDNTPPRELIPNLVATAQMLEAIRHALGGHAIQVTSGYRSPALNRAVGGEATSDHLSGRAADILVPAFGPPTSVAKALATRVSLLNIGQLILEGVGGRQWVHVSTKVPANPANRILTITDAGPRVGIHTLA